MANMRGIRCLVIVLLASSYVALGQDHFTTPDVFPSPNATGAGGWESALVLANDFISKLNLTEKAGMVTGSTSGGFCIGNIVPIERLNFTGLCVQDGPLAIRIADLASLFPAGVTAAATWDRELLYQRGFALGEEFRDKGSHVLLGPVAGPLGRHPLGGRNWEGFSTDPYLTGVAMNHTIRGTQDAGAQACAKHFIGNEQETQRSNTVLPDGTNVEAISANIDDRTMHELYMWPFADSVKAGVASIMCSYNRLNQTYACENSKLLNGLLKGELGFQGYVMSDFNAVHSGVRSIEAGLDMDMPGPIDASAASTGSRQSSYFGGNITAAVQNGSLAEARLDDMVRRTLLPYFFLEQQEGYPSVDPSTFGVLATTYGVLQNSLGVPPARNVQRDHAKLIRQIGAAGTVLLKNRNATLPLAKPMNIGVFGNDAAGLSAGLAFRGTDGLEARPYGFDAGTLAVGGGSGSGRAPYIVSPLQAVQDRAEGYGARVQYITDNAVLAADDFLSLFPTPDVCLVFLKTWAKESADRPAFKNDWNSTLVVDNVAARCPNTVVVTHSAGVNTMPWARNPNVTAILAAHYPGQESGNAIADVLFGDVNPSGRLPYTIPEREEDYGFPTVNVTGEAARDSANWQADFTEGLLIDYRHFDAKNITPLYEFGFGLSYTTFEISEPLAVVAGSKAQNVSALPMPASGAAQQPGGNAALWSEVLSLKTRVRNAGEVAGAAVVQLYMSLPGDAVPGGTPKQVLRGFDKVPLGPGESREVVFRVLRRDVSFWNVTAQAWQIPGGEARFRVGFSSRDVRGEAGVALL